MSLSTKILITGAAGFIGSSLVTALNAKGYRHLILSDNFNKPGKDRYLRGKFFDRKVDSGRLMEFLDATNNSVEFVFHLGGKTSNKSDFQNQNVIFPKELLNRCAAGKIPFVYASSSSVYGNGGSGYSDDHSITKKLHPTNDYGRSKLEFDQWILENGFDCLWAGLRIFNVYGPNEFHKGMSASVAFKTYFEIKERGSVSLFGSPDPDLSDGSQMRDFIYVKDVTSVFVWFLQQWTDASLSVKSGIYNLGTGVGNSFNEVAHEVFKTMNLPEKIHYIPVPEKISNDYRDKIIGDAKKLRAAGYRDKFTSLESGIDDLVNRYLMIGRYL